jgi:MarR family transcriptional regulator for hemolysin
MNDTNDIAFELGITARRWRAKADERLITLALSQAKWLPLSYLSRAGGSMPQRKLVEQLGVEGPTLVRILDELERRGLTERRDGDADRRTKTIHLTKKALPIIGKISYQTDLLREEILGGILDQDIVTFRKVLDQILNNIETIS